MMPFDFSNVITFWIPLHVIPLIEDGGTGSYWNGRQIDYEDDGHDFQNDNDDESYNAYENLTGPYGKFQNLGNDLL